MMTRTRKRFLFGAPLLAAGLLSVVGWWSHDAVRRTVETKLIGELGTVLDANVTALEIWVSNQERLAGLLANDPEVRQLASELVAASAGRELNRQQLGDLPQQARFQQLLGERVRAAGYGVAELVTTNLNIVAVTGRGPARLGGAVSESLTERYRALFASGKTVLITPFKALRPRGPGGPGMRHPGWLDTPEARLGGGLAAAPNRPRPEEGRPPGEALPPREGGERGGPPDRGPGGPRAELSLMQVVAPVRTAAGEVIGALACIVRPELEFTRVLSVARSGKTGETFAFDPSGLLISQSRFDDQLRGLGLLTNAATVTSSLNVTLRDPGVDLTGGTRLDAAQFAARPLMLMVADAVAGGGGVKVATSRDYRGVPVVGAWRWLPELNFGVLTKMDATEAYQSLRVLRLIFAALFALLALVTTITLMAAYLNVTWRRKFNEAALKARQLGQYTLDEKIGEGAMGVVYRAHHALLRRETAVKLLLPNRADANLIRQFEHEVRLTCQLTHPNTIQIYDYGRTADDIFYYAMELLRGLTLQELIDRHGAQPEARVLHLLTQVCGSLHEAHSAGLIHRDIKPGNLFLCERGGVTDTVKVLDFGLVGRVSEVGEGPVPALELPDTSRFLGTPLYMAPETIQRPGAGDARSDIYAVGAVGYMLLTGAPVFDGEDHTEVWQKHLTALPLPPSARSPQNLSQAVERIILRCLEKDPAGRPQSIAELTAALQACPLAGTWTPEQARTWWQRFGQVGLPQSVAKPGVKAEATLRINVSGRTGSPGGTEVEATVTGAV
jgi:hypothetical protein